MRDIVTKDCFYFSDGGKVHFCYDKKEDAYALVGSIREKYGYQGNNSTDITELIIPNTINGKDLKYISGETFECLHTSGPFSVIIFHRSIPVENGLS